MGGFTKRESRRKLLWCGCLTLRQPRIQVQSIRDRLACEGGACGIRRTCSDGEGRCDGSAAITEAEGTLALEAAPLSVEQRREVDIECARVRVANLLGEVSKTSLYSMPVRCLPVRRHCTAYLLTYLLTDSLTYVPAWRGRHRVRTSPCTRRPTPASGPCRGRDRHTSSSEARARASTAREPLRG